ncbi:hypothetical protein MTR_7g034250 [Medicago truncatula]|uniref:Uncharacterized protein n=1 Tax=Medicago truncatula TaxID=3880 RepID=A0A072TXG9_MEDTR|nr:hypothetical protein MTR_7g034250 [Medicago truncatula]
MTYLKWETVVFANSFQDFTDLLGCCENRKIATHFKVKLHMIIEVSLQHYTSHTHPQMKEYIIVIKKAHNIKSSSVLVFTTRKCGFSYKTFLRNFLESVFLRITDEIFVGKQLSVKTRAIDRKVGHVADCEWLKLPRNNFVGKPRPPHAEKGCVEACDWPNLPRNNFVGKWRSPHAEKGCVEACDWPTLPRNIFVGKLRPHMHTAVG